MPSNCGAGEDPWRVLWTARRSNQSILKEINPKYSLEGLMLKLKLQHFGHLMWRAYSLEKTLMLGKTEDRRRKGWQRMRWLDGITDSMDMSLSTNSRSWWCHPTVSSSVAILSFCLQIFPAPGSFPMSWLFTSGGQNIEASASALILPMNIQGWFPLGLTDLISLLPKGLSRVFSSSTVQKRQFFGFQPSLWSSSHIHTWLVEKP